jgi:hypothetical protein
MTVCSPPRAFVPGTVEGPLVSEKGERLRFKDDWYVTAKLLTYRYDIPLDFGENDRMIPSKRWDDDPTDPPETNNTTATPHQQRKQQRR